MKYMNAYTNKMDQVEPPAYLRNSVLAEVRELKSRAEQSDGHVQGKSKELLSATPRLRRMRFAFVTMGAAAVFVLVAVLVVAGAQGVLGQSQLDCGAAWSEDSFGLVAYASQPGVQYASNDGVVVFGAQGRAGADEDGMYSGCLFAIEGEGITQVKMSLSGGQLYGYAEQDYVRLSPYDADLDERTKALSLIDQKLGGAHDPKNEGGSSVDMKTFTVSGTRLLGSECTFTTVPEEGGFDLEQLKFGFWIAPENLATTEAFDQDLGMAWRQSLDILDGHVLKVEVQYVDGSHAEQAYTLRVGKMKVEYVNGSDIVVLPEKASENEPGEYAVYGTLTS